jgi:hypothetical protein
LSEPVRISSRCNALSRNCWSGFVMSLLTWQIVLPLGCGNTQDLSRADLEEPGSAHTNFQSERAWNSKIRKKISKTEANKWQSEGDGHETTAILLHLSLSC